MFDTMYCVINSTMKYRSNNPKVVSNVKASLMQRLFASASSGDSSNGVINIAIKKFCAFMTASLVKGLCLYNIRIA